MATIAVTADDYNRVSDTLHVAVRAQAEVEATGSGPQEEQDVSALYDAKKDGVISPPECRALVFDLGSGAMVSDLIRIRQAGVDGSYRQYADPC